MAKHDGADHKVGLTRRSLLSQGISASTIALVPLVSSCTSPAPVASLPAVFSPEQTTTLIAIVDRLIPADELSPAASDCGVIEYFNHSLNAWNQQDLPLLQAGLAALEEAARGAHQQSFTKLGSEQQDQLLIQMEAGELPAQQAQAAFNRIYRLTLEGMFSDPYYGGNRAYAGWDLIGYPGAVLASTQDMQKMGGRLPPLHTSAYGAQHDGH